MAGKASTSHVSVSNTEHKVMYKQKLVTNGRAITPCSTEASDI